jgi:hypothetical protein
MRCDCLENKDRLCQLELQMQSVLALLEAQRSDTSRILAILSETSRKPTPFNSSGTPTSGGFSSPASPLFSGAADHRTRRDSISSSQGAKFNKYINKLQDEVLRRTEHITILEPDEPRVTMKSRRRSTMPASDAITYASKALESVRGSLNLPKKASSRWMLSPASPWRFLWDFAVMMPMLVYLTIMMPFRLSFDYEPSFGSGSWFWEFCIEIVSAVRIHTYIS